MSGFPTVVPHKRKRIGSDLSAIWAGPSHRVVEYSCERWFRAKLGRWLRMTRVTWPECPVRIALDGRYLMVRQGHYYSEDYGRTPLTMCIQ
jgi:hypothetical protein